MNPRKRAILERRGGEIAKAGRLFFDAMFGRDDPEKVLEQRAEELELEQQRGAIVVDGELVEDDEPAPRAPSRRPRGR